MSILDRNIKKGEITFFGKELNLTGDLGVWTEYFKNIPFSSCGIEEVQFHLENIDIINQLAQKEFSQTSKSDECYLTFIQKNRIDVYAVKPIGLIYAVENIKSHIENGAICCGTIFNYPDKP